MAAVAVVVGALLALAASGAVGCDDAAEGGALLPELRVTSVGPEPLLPGTRLVVRGEGFVVDSVAALAVSISGDVGGASVELTVRPERQDDRELVVPITGDVEAAIIGATADGARLRGTLTVARAPRVDAPEAAATHALDVAVARTASPSIASLAPESLWVGERVALSGSGFIHPSEGVSLVQLDGTMTTTSPPRSYAISGLQIPGEAPDAASRDALAFTLTPDVLGVVPGRFAGTIRVVNQHVGGEQLASEPWDVDGLTLAAPTIEALTPDAASRGQYITVEGRGFTPPDGLLQAATVLVLDGTFTARGGATQRFTGADVLTLVPDRYEGNALAQAVLRVDVDTDGRLSGLGLVPGQFSGTIAPLVLLGPDRVQGAPLAIDFEVLPQRQVVYIKLLPSFDDALERFGLLAEGAAVRARILEVVERAYSGVHASFTFTVPEDFAEYSVVEVAGYDPNGTGLFGLDNTAGKDVGNQRFDDVIGGYNAETGADGYAAYGGVFPAEFMRFSAAIGDNAGRTPRFDEVFAAVAPELGGTPAAPGEADGGGGRAARIREAVRVFANLCGDTIAHEVGHSLGLSAVSGQFHNLGDNPGWLMDSGAYRPFTERAQLDGDGPSSFGPPSRRYLEEILPIDP